MTNKQIEIVTIQGSVRPGNYTGKALALVVDEMRKREEVHVQVFDPAKMTLSFPGQDSDTGDAAQFKAAVARASGVVLSTPEYHGGYSSVIKMMIENLGFPSALSGKPVALLGVAAGQIGAIKSLESLRSICAHVGSIVLPGSVSIAGVQDVFDKEGHCLDAQVETRIRGLGQKLLEYIETIICANVPLDAMVRAKNL
ncbi:hypothetical protein MNBD_NITROSPIRAE01-1257 [hydrothermal vent metagenome]|uniref:NADPH-dependent FMN reductase-like domain-containing protein n=1 Tax=hydrothermal vent metagenome TaxID=652676 RepID=A0A3B1CG08_9ZZZZ